MEMQHEQPFMFGIPADDAHFIGREKELSRLLANFNYGVNTILMSPRRWGKTSLVRRAAQAARGSKCLVVQMDAFACRSEYDFYNAFSAAILGQTASKIDEWKELAKGFIERLTPKFSFAADAGGEYAVSLGITPSTHTPDEVLELPERIAERKGVRLVVCIDEFQQVGEFPGALEVQKRLRGVWQRQRNVSYCLYGSKMHMMMQFFQRKSHPFYRFGEILNLETIPIETWTPYIRERFAAFGKRIDDAFIVRICQVVSCQASYVQQLAYSVFLLSDKEVTEASFTRGVEDLLAQNSNLFVEQTQSLTAYQLNFLRALLDGVSTGFGEAAVRERYNLGSPSNIQRLKTALVEKELVELTEGGFIFSDPVLKLWLKRIL